MKIFITGAAGFIGRATVKELIGRGHSLLALVRVKRQVEGVASMNSVQTIIGDFSDPAKYRAALRKFRPDAAIHLAWEGIPDNSLKLAIKNIASSMLVFNEFYEAGVKKIIGIGSCREYGDPWGKVNESASISSPYNLLYAAKAHLYRLSSAFFEKSGVDFIWVRPFYVYGPGQRSGSLIPSAIRAKVSGQDLEIKDKRAANDFIFVEDVARALTRIIEKHRIGHSGVYNIGSGKMVNVLDVLNLVSGLTGQKSAPSKGFFADISRMTKEIGWRPRITIKEGITKTTAHYNK